MNAKECLDHIIELVRSGKFLGEIKRNPLKMFSCLIKMVSELADRLGAHDDKLYGSGPDTPDGDDFVEGCRNVAAEMQSAGLQDATDDA